MRRIVLLAALSVALLAALPGSALGYTTGHLMDDVVMNNNASMTEAQVETLLLHSPCLASYTETGFHWDGSSWHYEETWTAAKIVFEAAHMWGLNPQVVIATLQQQEGLLTTSACEAWKYSSAMGYACPDAGECNPKYAGFSKQVLWGSYQLEFNLQRSQGHTAWDEDGSLVYSGFMLKGLFARCESCELAEFSGEALIDETEVYLETGATASLYSYTPHLAGGRLFVEIFEEYFGPTLTEEAEPEEPPEEPEKGKEESGEPEKPEEPIKEEPHPSPVSVPEQVVTTPAPAVSVGPSLLQVRAEPAPRCIPPQLKGKTLAQTRKLIARAGCTLGKVSKRKPHRKHQLRVVHQRPAAGTNLHAGSKVDVRLG